MVVTLKKNFKKNLLPLLPTTKLTFGPNVKGPSREWHMKFFRKILSIIPTSPEACGCKNRHLQKLTMTLFNSKQYFVFQVTNQCVKQNIKDDIRKK